MDLDSMPSFPVAFASSRDMHGVGKWSQLDQNGKKKGLLNPYLKKMNLTTIVESPDFFHGSPDFPLSGVDRSASVSSVM